MKRAQTQILLALLVSSVLSSCAVYVRPVPPPPRYRVIGVAPAPGYVWADGYWDWRGQAWVWEPGRWLLPPRPGLVWVPGHWRQGYRRWVFVRGHWR